MQKHLLRAAQVDGAIVIATLAPDMHVRSDTNVWLDFDQNRLHLFDGETQMALKLN